MRLACGLGYLLLLGALAAPADAADRLYWVNEGGNKLSFVNLDTSSAGDLNTAGATMSIPSGTALDPAAGRIYWSNAGVDAISFTNLDGSGGGDLDTTGATLDNPRGIAVDPAARRIYWANNGGGTISFAGLDGGGGGDLVTTGATVGGPWGVALDPAAGRIYWANNVGQRISFANLNGSGGADLTTTGATVNGPDGVAVDSASGRVYWTNAGDKISFANLNGSGGADLTTTGATVSLPTGVALDQAGGRIYWGNTVGNKLSFANLNGSGGGDVLTLAATVDGPGFPALLTRPGGAGAPSITGGSVVGSTLSCSNGTWAADLLPAFYYSAPRSFEFRWSRDGVEVAGAGSSSLTADVAGAYGCSVTASNHAGGSSQASGPHAVAAAPPAFGIRTLVRLRLAVRRVPPRGPVRIRVSNANGFLITGRLSGQTTNRVSVSRTRRLRLRASSFRVAGHARKTVKLGLSRALRRVLRDDGELKLRLTAKVRDPAGNTRTVRKRVAPQLR